MKIHNHGLHQYYKKTTQDNKSKTSTTETKSTITKSNLLFVSVTCDITTWRNNLLYVGRHSLVY